MLKRREDGLGAQAERRRYENLSGGKIKRKENNLITGTEGEQFEYWDGVHILKRREKYSSVGRTI